MHYKTTALGLIRSRPALYRRLKATRRLAAALDAHAAELMASHLAWTNRLTQDRPGADPHSLASAALELALAELADRLASEASPSDSPSEP